MDNRVCYDESIFNNSRDTPGRRDTLKAFAPIALYLQEVTGYPASMILSQRIKEQGWPTRAPRNNHFGVKCYNPGQEQTFQTPTGHTFTYRSNACGLAATDGGNFMDYPTTLDSFLSYIDVVLYREETAGFYGNIREQVPRRFPPPGPVESMTQAMSEGPYCQAGCTCPNGRGGSMSYGSCMSMHRRTGCMSELDSMTLCDYSIPQLAGLPPLHNNIRPSTNIAEGTRTPISPNIVTSDIQGEETVQ